MALGRTGELGVYLTLYLSIQDYFDLLRQAMKASAPTPWNGGADTERGLLISSRDSELARRLSSSRSIDPVFPRPPSLFSVPL
ncbi:hypothetical protein SKAU_G00108230 [Synaphobranchus kaupii]|uniref:Uncharacterized protein n=1 Tax=Synaphobranchus kaupii TaxID=118154 RepID=A0A9Q1G0R1_SYNKA|nr:hypothetical protein SKAU_G00108230 [Synaphobranchus kaupii]